jgi:co-chaperonin GroES (HSP10)
MGFHVIGKNILIVPQAEETKSAGGLIMTVSDAGEVRYKKATVVAAGSTVDGIKPGAFIYFDRAAGHSIRINEDLYTVITEKDVVVVL